MKTIKRLAKNQQLSENQQKIGKKTNFFPKSVQTFRYCHQITNGVLVGTVMAAAGTWWICLYLHTVLLHDMNYEYQKS